MISPAVLLPFLELGTDVDYPIGEATPPSDYFYAVIARLTAS